MRDKEFTITEDHLKLLRRAYIGWEDCEYGAPAIDCKRPYGNSSVELDICEILGWEPKKDEYGDTSDDNQKLYEKCYEIHKETQTVLQIALATGQFKAGKYTREDEYSEGWKFAG